MSDNKKFTVVAALSTLLVVSIISYNVFHDYLSTEVGSYLKRRAYFETVILKKGLPLHDAKHWRKMDK